MMMMIHAFSVIFVKQVRLCFRRRSSTAAARWTYFLLKEEQHGCDDVQGDAGGGAVVAHVVLDARAPRVQEVGVLDERGEHVDGQKLLQT